MHCSYKRKMPKYGDRKSVFDGLSGMTRGGLRKDDLILKDNGKIVSKRKSEAAKITYGKYGFAKRTENKKEAEKKKRGRKKKNNEDTA